MWSHPSFLATADQFDKFRRNSALRKYEIEHAIKMMIVVKIDAWGKTGHWCYRSSPNWYMLPLQPARNTLRGSQPRVRNGYTRVSNVAAWGADMKLPKGREFDSLRRTTSKTNVLHCKEPHSAWGFFCGNFRRTYQLTDKKYQIVLHGWVFRKWSRWSRNCFPIALFTLIASLTSWQAPLVVIPITIYDCSLELRSVLFII